MMETCSARRTMAVLEATNQTSDPWPPLTMTAWDNLHFPLPNEGLGWHHPTGSAHLSEEKPRLRQTSQLNRVDSDYCILYMG